MKEPGGLRCVYEETAASIRVVVPSRRGQLTSAILQRQPLALIAAGALGLYFASLIVGYLATGASMLWMSWVAEGRNAGFSQVAEFIAAWSLPAVLVVFSFLFDWLWQVTGREVIEVNESSITIKRLVTIGRKDVVLPWPKKYLLKHVDDFYVYGHQGWTGRVVFRYRAGLIPMQVRFGAGVAKEEADRIFAGIAKRYPEFAAARRCV